MERWQNKVAVVTGASGGIGAACTRNLLAKGMIVVGLARRREQMETVLKAALTFDQMSRFHAVQCDVRREIDISEAFAWIAERLGAVHILINCAGIYRYTHIVTESDTSDLRDIIDTNLMGVALCTRKAFHSMKQHGIDGHIVILNSLCGHRVPHVPGLGLNMYAPSKYALTGMTEVLRQEFLLHQTRIKVTSISPGAVDTEIIGERAGLPTEFPLLRPEDVADAVVYCIQTPPHVQIHELIIEPMGEMFFN